MFISKEKRDKINLLNSLLGMKHRSTPFDFARNEDIIEAVELITAEYVDMYQYWATISELNSQLDESIECFYSAEWISISQEGTTNDDELDEAIEGVNLAEDALRILMERAEQKCKDVWELIVLSDLKTVKQHFWGEDISSDRNRLNEILEDEMYEICSEILYNGNVQSSTESFANGLLRRLKNKF
ncbi:hypothetical protein ABU162_28625 [Paenibacillus thiaminolyticus]|uniref:hypothetical protein n=1 Tax=Paenibacillus thiaminolyticus TaxID=49283 RepID=UPI0035A5CBC2